MRAAQKVGFTTSTWTTAILWLRRTTSKRIPGETPSSRPMSMATKSGVLTALAANTFPRMDATGGLTLEVNGDSDGGGGGIDGAAGPGGGRSASRRAADSRRRRACAGGTGCCDVPCLGRGACDVKASGCWLVSCAGRGGVTMAMAISTPATTIVEATTATAGHALGRAGLGTTPGLPSSSTARSGSDRGVASPALPTAPSREAVSPSDAQDGVEARRSSASSIRRRSFVTSFSRISASARMVASL